MTTTTTTTTKPSFQTLTSPFKHNPPQLPLKLSRKPSKILCSQSPDHNSQQSPPKFVSLVSIIRSIPDWADGIKERRMKQRRPLYKHHDWVRHRSSVRHLRHLLSSFNSRVILSLVPPVIAFTSVAAVVASYNTAVVWHLLPEVFPVLRASSLPYQLTAPALALLLVFRTEASYSRFEEGRKAWGRVVSGTNDFARQDDDLAILLSSNHHPRCIIQFISQSMKLLELEETKRTVLESKVTCLHEGIGVCEQIVGIPIPLSYTRLTSRFLVLWHLTLPIILWDDCNWIVVPATFVSAASLFCIEEVGVLIEEPFQMLSLDELCIRVCENVQEAMKREKEIRETLIMKKEAASRDPSLNGHPTSGDEQKNRANSSSSSSI
ncbi:hypothetical protein M8C21_005500 [Ambrosia artemisiifolia]|uniref:Uncharacterized protein n=1 Tax=Ambrosia artemisiifolia TaxID=4212 RepID=A0AAD5C9Y2_AMBAR|nr:hypothetical protein M8C21_005500 [Ambrosia artemisiifolia]